MNSSTAILKPVEPTTSSSSSGSSLGTLSDEPPFELDPEEAQKGSGDNLEHEEKPILQICKICGKEIREVEEKKIPSQTAWLCFFCLFSTFFWWISWLPFVLEGKACGCKNVVKVCPHCYRRTDRIPV